MPSIFEWFNPAGMVPARFKRILSGEFGKASWQLDTARKDARLMIEAADRGGVPLTIIPAVAKEMDRWIANGHGTEDWTVIASEAAHRQSDRRDQGSGIRAGQISCELTA